jgi:hypothetical protein
MPVHRPRYASLAPAPTPSAPTSSLRKASIGRAPPRGAASSPTSWCMSASIGLALLTSSAGSRPQSTKTSATAASSNSRHSCRPRKGSSSAGSSGYPIALQDLRSDLFFHGKKFKIQGVELSVGDIIAMAGDFYPSLTDLLNADPANCGRSAMLYERSGKASWREARRTSVIKSWRRSTSPVANALGRTHLSAWPK